MKTLPKGFKDSDIGPIPQDWEMGALGRLAMIARGGSPRPIESYLTQSPKGINWVKIGDVASDSKYIEHTEERIIPEGANHSKRVQCGDLILSNSMSYGRPYIMHIGGCIHDGWLSISKFSDVFDKEFLYYLLGSELTLAQYDEVASGSSVKNLNKIVVSKVLLPYPTALQEQQVIARALSDMDDLISSQEELLAKKRAIKQGAMQELLTGRRRLPGFSSRPMRQTDIGPIPEDWEVKELGEIGVCLTTASYSRAQLKAAGDVKYIHYGDIHVKYKYLLDVGKTELPYIESCMVKQFALLQNGDLIIADASEDYEGLGDCIEVCGAGNTMCIGGLHTILYRPGKHVFAKGYICLLREIGSVYKQLATLAVGTKVYSLTANVIKQLQVPLPPYAEQEAIATVLSDMDAEITALEAELAKQRALKRGMMQELLSGRIRLPYNKPTHGKQHA